MNQALRYLSRHNVWATKTLLDVCGRLTPAELTSPGTATYGSIIETFNHLVTSDAGYLASLGGPETTWVAASSDQNEGADLDELARRVHQMEGLWEAFFASEAFDADRIVRLDEATYECPTGIVMAQVFHHGSLHREQICAMVTALGIEPPDLQPWAFADETGVSRFRGGRTE